MADFARRGATGMPLNLAQYMSQERAAGNTNFTDPHQWLVQPICQHKGCAGEMHTRLPQLAVNQLLAIRAAGHEVTSRKRPGFDHKDHEASASCPDAYSSHPNYKDYLSGINFERGARERNLAILKEPKIERQIQVLSQVLLHDLTRSSPRPDDIKALNEISNRLTSMEFLQVAPHYLPVLSVVLFTGERTYKSGKKIGKPFKVAFQPSRENRQNISYTDLHGQSATVSLPSKLFVCFANKTKHGLVLKPIQNPGSKTFMEIDVSMGALQNRARAILGTQMDLIFREEPAVPMAVQRPAQGKPPGVK